MMSSISCLPVPQGIKFPKITFSFKPLRWSTCPLTEASVKIFFVSWNDAADKNESLLDGASSRPKIKLTPVANCLELVANIFSFSSLNLFMSTTWPIKNGVSPGLNTWILFVNCLMITSIYLSEISIPCNL